MKLPVLGSFQQNVGLKTVTKEKLKQSNLPEKPKRPLTPFLRFCGEHRQSILKDNPQLKLGEIAKKCSQDWKDAHITIKEKYEQEYKTELTEYAQKLDAYEKSLSEEQKQLIKNVEKEKKQDRKKRKIRKMEKEANKPKRPLGPFMYYLMELAKKENKKMNEIVKEVKGKWELVPENEKKRYQDLYLQDKLRYEREMKEWEAKMIREGNKAIVRNTTLKNSKPSRLIKAKQFD